MTNNQNLICTFKIFIHGRVSVESFFLLYANGSFNYTQRKVTESIKEKKHFYFLKHEPLKTPTVSLNTNLKHSPD